MNILDAIREGIHDALLEKKLTPMFMGPTHLVVGEKLKRVDLHLQDDCVFMLVDTSPTYYEYSDPTFPDNLVIAVAKIQEL